MEKHLPVVLLSVISGTTACAHSAHTQVTEVEWNSASGRFEVAMKLNAAALEDSVSIRTGDRFRLESSKHVDDVLAELMPMCFQIDVGNFSETGTVRWAGHELQLHTVWLYFEYLPGSAQDPQLTESSTPARSTQIMKFNEVTVENKCLMDVRPDVVHFIQLRHGNIIRYGHCSSEKPRTDFTEQERTTSTEITSSAAGQFIRVP